MSLAVLVPLTAPALWHIPVIEGGMRLSGLDRPGTPPLAMLAMLGMLGVLFALTAAVSIASFRWVEAPFLEYRTPKPHQPPESPASAEPPGAEPRPVATVTAGPVGAWEHDPSPLAPAGAR